MAKADYVAPAMLIADVETAIARGLGLNTATATDLTAIDEAITAAGLAACTWRGRPWWWQEATAYFTTNTKTITTVALSGATRTSNVAQLTMTATHGVVAGQTIRVSGVSDSTFDGVHKVKAVVAVAKTIDYYDVGAAVGAAAAGTGYVYVVSYPIRQLEVSGLAGTTLVAEEAWAIKRVYHDDDWRIQPIPWVKMRQNLRLHETHGASKPFLYCIHGEEPYLYLWPPPAAAYDTYLDLVRRHSKITSAGSNDAALIVPAEFHRGVYVDGGQWLLQHETFSPQSLRDCPMFKQTMDDMAASDPSQYDDKQSANLFPDAVGEHPHDRRVWMDGDGVLIENPPATL